MLSNHCPYCGGTLGILGTIMELHPWQCNDGQPCHPCIIVPKAPALRNFLPSETTIPNEVSRQATNVLSHSHGSDLIHLMNLF